MSSFDLADPYVNSIRLFLQPFSLLSYTVWIYIRHLVLHDRNVNGYVARMNFVLRVNLLLDLFLIFGVLFRRTDLFICFCFLLQLSNLGGLISILILSLILKMNLGLVKENCTFHRLTMVILS